MPLLISILCNARNPSPTCLDIQFPTECTHAFLMEGGPSWYRSLKSAFCSIFIVLPTQQCQLNMMVQAAKEMKRPILCGVLPPHLHVCGWAIHRHYVISLNGTGYVRRRRCERVWRAGLWLGFGCQLCHCFGMLWQVTCSCLCLPTFETGIILLTLFSKCFETEW